MRHWMMEFILVEVLHFPFLFRVAALSIDLALLILDKLLGKRCVYVPVETLWGSTSELFLLGYV